jgi:cytokinin riboside 5'-monophosphate phosphoribohydrolase
MTARRGVEAKMSKRLTIAVYCSASDAVAPEFFAEARKLGRLIGTHGHALVYGGCHVGLMGEVAKAVHEHNGTVYGVIPEAIHNRGLGYLRCEELLVTPDMASRKLAMEDRADAFIALPGGFGTLEEIVQVLNLKTLQYHTKPIVLINTLGFYDKLLLFFEHLFEERFAKHQSKQMFYVAKNASDALEHILNYTPPQQAEKWFSKQG